MKYEVGIPLYVTVDARDSVAAVKKAAAYAAALMDAAPLGEVQVRGVDGCTLSSAACSIKVLGRKS